MRSLMNSLASLLLEVLFFLSDIILKEKLFNCYFFILKNQVDRLARSKIWTESWPSPKNSAEFRNKSQAQLPS